METILNKIQLIFQRIISSAYYLLVSILFLFSKFVLVITRDNKDSFKTFDSQGYLRLSEAFPNSFFNSSDSSLQELSLLRTPGYPIFLWILNDNPIAVALTQSLVQIFMAYISILIFREIAHNPNKKYEKTIFVLVNLESSLVVHSLYLLGDLLFSFFVSLFMLFFIKYIKRKQFSKRIFLAVSLVMITAITIRPIGVILLIYLPLIGIFTREFKRVSLLLGILIVWIGAWSGYNLIRADIFVYSTIQNHNLLMYEGAGAKAMSQQIDLKVSQKQELLLRDKKVGVNATLSEIDSYSFKRGIELIKENFGSFLKLHGIGILKILFGPNQGETIRFISDGNRVKAESDIERILVATFSLFAFILGTVSICAITYFLFSNGIGRWIASISIIFIIFSSGSQAYGRFRAPLAVFMIVLCINLFASLSERRRNQENSKTISELVN